MAYHVDKIEKGEVGKSSKILEEVNELIDAEKQGNKIMSLVELSDIVGAVRLYLEDNFKDITVNDLVVMSNATISAFKDGTRK